ncbi:acyltransferase [Clostridium tagluense]|uniref:acyltransferase family protein n=1 Tax=Clostridium tagluense TaxID=360422 RepID=UPI001CF3B9A7|nr:acyltransferase [Clostridium tagluense]MCB2312031.1 acyltransferase [Clostridium tagluense]MCB2316618.1 acyltransferase [Clostridium tagluense]MCB2321446.1 acyltransferase [Clostridium tagluense]MCB2326458.1 acyltransferase [Clostridium tagluense]MCB2331210.1 acyltransferase [Clostridium tagluense]
MDNIKKKKDQSISLVRVLAMFLIILCHIVEEFQSIEFMGQIFNVGVSTFIFISGFLYGKKDIDNTRSWLIKRLMRILIPMYVYMIFFFLARVVLLHQIDFKYYFVYLLNIQGFIGGFHGTMHLWFLSAIMICYFITPLLNKIKSKVIVLTKIRLIISLLMLISVQVLSSYFINKMLGLYLSYVILYIFAYFFSSLWNKSISKKGLAIFTLLSALAVLLRLAAKFIVDGSIIYDNVIVLYTQSVFGVWIFIFVGYFKKIASNSIVSKFVDNLDGISFEIYIVHYIFIRWPLRVMFLTQYTIVNIVLVLVLSYISGLLLHKVCKLIYNLKFFRRIMYKKNDFDMVQ